MIDTRNGISVSSAMETILTWLKQGYTLGYSPTNKRRDGTYRTIEVRLASAVNPASTSTRSTRGRDIMRRPPNKADFL